MSTKLLDLVNITKSYDGVTILDDLNLYIRENEFLTLLGPSGCGKTTTLRILGGFETPDAGKVLFNGQDITQLPPNKRQLNTVFQKYALFTHMTIAENIAFGLKIKGKSKAYIDDKIKYALKLVNLEGYENRSPALLSGGQQQRIAIARALVNEPSVLLLDEPLGALDLKLRKEMQQELKKIQQEVGITFIYVTHDQTEAMTLGTKIVVMKDGVIQQVASPEELYNCPANTFVAGFIGMPPMNFFQGKCCRGGEYGTYLQIGDFAVNLTEEDAERVFRKGYMGEVITVGVRPEDLVLTEEGTEHEVLVYEMLGAETYLYFTYEGKDVALRTNADTPYRRGDRISFCLRNDKLHLFDGDTGIRI